MKFIYIFLLDPNLSYQIAPRLRSRYTKVLPFIFLMGGIIDRSHVSNIVINLLWSRFTTGHENGKGNLIHTIYSNVTKE